MTVLGLTPQGEVRVQLNPSGRNEPYLRKVRELLSGHVLGSPGGYPVYLKRWTRMGQMRDESLEQLLLLGEPEAVVAAVCAPGISDELARRAWWAMEDAENGRRLLSSPAVAGGRMGPVLAAYLVDYLPFETEPEPMIESVRLVLQPGLLDAAGRADLWKKARRKLAYYVGFLAAVPDELPADARPLVLPSGGLDKRPTPGGPDPRLGTRSRPSCVPAGAGLRRLASCLPDRTLFPGRRAGLPLGPRLAPLALAWASGSGWRSAVRLA